MEFKVGDVVNVPFDDKPYIIIEILVEKPPRKNIYKLNDNHWYESNALIKRKKYKRTIDSGY